MAILTQVRERPFRFGLLAAGAPEATGQQWRDRARRAEDDGCSTLLVGDHYLTPNSCAARLGMAATVTSTLRLGSYVYCNDFRHPALTAKEAAELDRLSDGRFELGIGAGWLKEEYDMVGLPFDAPKVRVDRFQEAVGIVRRLLAGEVVTHHGEHYNLEEYEPPALPVQSPVPILIGCGGPRMLRYAGRHADIVGFDPMALPTGGKDDREFAATAFAERVESLDEVCAGRSDGGPERSIVVFDVARTLDALPEATWVDRAVVAESPYALVGSPSGMADTLRERRARWGLSYVVFFEEDFEHVRPVVAALAGT